MIGLHHQAELALCTLIGYSTSSSSKWPDDNSTSIIFSNSMNHFKNTGVRELTVGLSCRPCAVSRTLDWRRCSSVTVALGDIKWVSMVLFPHTRSQQERGLSFYADKQLVNRSACWSGT